MDGSTFVFVFTPLLGETLGACASIAATAKAFFAVLADAPVPLPRSRVAPGEEEEESSFCCCCSTPSNALTRSLYALDSASRISGSRSHASGSAKLHNSSRLIFSPSRSTLGLLLGASAGLLDGVCAGLAPGRPYSM